MQDHFEKTIREVDDFLAGKSKVHTALERVSEALDAMNVEYALAGGLALVEHGYVRLTVDVDLVITPEGLRRFKEQWLGRGFVEKFPGSRGVREAETGVAIDFLVAGDFPGDGQPKPVRFPNPSSISRQTEGGRRVLDLRTLIELKIASGISAPDRLRDLSDVIELIRSNRLPAQFDANLDASVRAKYGELWRIAQSEPRDL